MKRILVCGGRDRMLTPDGRARLAGIAGDDMDECEVVHGDATGIDTAASLLAMQSGSSVKPFPADWAGMGRAAGPARNAQMAKYLEPYRQGSVVVAFDGGAGTENMVKQALGQGLKVVDLRGEKGLTIPTYQSEQKWITPGRETIRDLVKGTPGLWVFTDGGVIGKNPSREGGVSAYIVVRDEQPICHKAVVVSPGIHVSGEVVTNNDTETLAIIGGLRAAIPYAGAGETINLASDSFVAICRTKNGKPGKNYCERMHRKMQVVLDPLAQRRVDIRYHLLAGHPDEKGNSLLYGYKNKDGLAWPSSHWNDKCDKMCNAAKERRY